MSEFPLLTTIIWGVLGITVGCTVVLAFNIWKMRREEKATWKYDEGSPMAHKDKQVQVFCQDCGTALQSQRTQTGYNGTTGAAVYSYIRKCAKAGSGVVDCGQRLKVSYTPGMHNHMDASATELTCPACLDVLLENGVLPPDEASKLYAAAGVTFDRSHDPAYQRAVQLGSYPSLFNSIYNPKP